MYRLFPSFCLGDCLLQLALCDHGSCPRISSAGYDFTSTQSPFAWDITGANLVFLLAESIVYFLIVLLIEYLLTFPSIVSWIHTVPDPGLSPDFYNTEDEDVFKERQRVLRGDADSDVVRLSELRKIYSNSNSCVPSLLMPKSSDNVKIAVQSLCFGIPRGECFGFLGINGAGKTTTLSILSGEFPSTNGGAFIDGYDINFDQSKIRRKIGYCPQCKWKYLSFIMYYYCTVFLSLIYLPVSVYLHIFT